jgi:hypothetical protein
MRATVAYSARWKELRGSGILQKRFSEYEIRASAPAVCRVFEEGPNG